MKISFLFLAFIAAASAFGQTPNPSGSPAPSKFDSELLGGTNPVLNDQERAGVEVTRAWQDKSFGSLVSQPGLSNSVKFRFDESYPTIVCAVLQVTDIELQAGEALTHVNLGDATRWTVEEAMSGSGVTQIQHLIIKPRDIGLSTSLVVTTDRRTYHLLLASDEKEFFHDVAFVYPAPSAVLVAATPTPTPAPKVAAKDAPPKKKQSDGKAVVSDPPDDVDAKYEVKGNAEWAPVEVYSLNGKTFIEMPDSVRHKEAPVLFEEKRSGTFHHSKDLVNYRVHGKWYMVDRVLDDAVLVSGVGYSQQKVTIHHIRPKKKEMGVVCNGSRP